MSEIPGTPKTVRCHEKETFFFEDQDSIDSTLILEGSSSPSVSSLLRSVSSYRKNDKASGTLKDENRTWNDFRTNKKVLFHPRVGNKVPSVNEPQTTRPKKLGFSDVLRKAKSSSHGRRRLLPQPKRWWEEDREVTTTTRTRTYYYLPDEEANPSFQRKKDDNDDCKSIRSLPSISRALSSLSTTTSTTRSLHLRSIGIPQANTFVRRERSVSFNVPRTKAKRKGSQRLLALLQQGLYRSSHEETITDDDYSEDNDHPQAGSFDFAIGRAEF